MRSPVHRRLHLLFSIAFSSLEHRCSLLSSTCLAQQPSRSSDLRSDLSKDGRWSSCPGGTTRERCARRWPSAEPEGPGGEAETADKEAVLPGVESSGRGSELRGYGNHRSSGPGRSSGGTREDSGELWSAPAQPAVRGTEDIWDHWRGSQVAEEGTGEAELPFSLLR